MDNRKLQFRVGVMVFATGLIAASLILLMGEKPASFREKYTLYVTFPDAPSVTPETPVRTSGILIGRVSAVELLREGGVQVTLEVFKDVSLPANDVCEVSRSLLGDAEVRFRLPPGQKASTQSILPEALIEGQVAADPIQTIRDLRGGLSEAIGSVSGTSKDLNVLINHVSEMLDRNEKHIDQIIVQSNETLGMIKSSAEFSNSLFGDEKFREDLRSEVQKLPDMFREARETVSDLRKTMNNMNHTMGLVDQNLENIKDFTEPLGDNGPGIVTRMNDSVDKLNRLMSEMEIFSKSLNSDQGSLGKLVKDKELYEHLNRAARNIDEVSSKLRPIVNDARIISDNLARNPGSILRDAVQPGNGTKGLPPSR